jgi:ATP-dependent RNA helicase RhlE
MNNTFSSLNLDPSLVEGIESLGFKTMTPVQADAIPAGLKGKDLIACAQTGTGKTAAYLIPVLQHLKQKNRHGLSCLIIVPTRELAGQIDQHVTGLGYFTGISSFPIYGGSDSDNFSAQKRALENQSEIIIATPGRLIMLMKLGRVNFDSITHFILDEADKMLEMGFVEDISYIEKKLPFKKQTMMFSATMPPKIRHFAKRILIDPVEVNIAVSKLASGISEEFYRVEEGGKIPLLQRLVEKTENIGRMIIFTGRKDSADQIRIKLKERGIDSKTLHSGKEQSDREKTLQEFKNKELKILVATNVVSRGIDIDGISHILNFDVPKDAEDYIHRAGRTARVDKTGKAITFVNREDQRNLYGIEKLTEKKPNFLPLPEDLSRYKISPSTHSHSSGANRNPKRFKRKFPSRRK